MEVMRFLDVRHVCAPGARYMLSRHLLIEIMHKGRTDMIFGVADCQALLYAMSFVFFHLDKMAG